MNFASLRALIESGQSNDFIQQITNNPFNLAERDNEFGCSLLDWAAINNRVEIVSFLCEQKPELLALSAQKRSSVHYAARYGSTESLKLLLEYSIKTLEFRDHDGKTALDLAMQYKHIECARILINAGATLPPNSNFTLPFNPLDYVLYSQGNERYQLLTPSELKALQEKIAIEREMATLSLHGKKSLPKQLSYQLQKNHLESTEDFILKLIDKYLYLCNRIYKESREEKHGAEALQIKERVQFSREKRASLLMIIRLIVLTNKIEGIEPNFLIQDNIAKYYLKNFLHQKQNSHQRYFGDDLSDNSDSEDENDYLAYKATPIELSDKKTSGYAKIGAKHTPKFWLKTKLSTPQNAGLKKKIITIKQSRNLETLPKKLKDLVKKTLNSDLQERGKIEYEHSILKENLELIQKINACNNPKELEDLLKNFKKPIFIIGTRGINYMLDRWSADARRYHRKIDEYQQPQFSEAVLKTLPYDYYSELGPQHDFHQNPEETFVLQIEALRLSSFFQSLNQTGPCIQPSANHTDGNYLFSSAGDYLQDHFSNGVDNYLDELADNRKRHPNHWGKYLRNSFNPGMAIGSRPYHALKYTFGLKDYYPRSMQPRYWQDGTIEYSHVGKVYLSLHPLQEILAVDGPNNLSMQDRQARVSLGDQISPEKELSFLGFMPGDRVFHHFVAKFPSFKGAWKNIYQIKYGLDKETYEAFQYLIRFTAPESNERNSVINLLAEWLCAYHEVLLIETAKEEALRRGGMLAYIDREGKLSLEPENGRIFTRGNVNIGLRNEVHTLREIRMQLAQRIQQTMSEKNFPGLRFVSPQTINALLNRLHNDEAFLIAITQKNQLTSIEDGMIYARKTTEYEIRKKYGKEIMQGLIKHGLYSSLTLTSSTKKITSLVDQNHLYTDLEINTLLHQALDNIPDVDIYAPQHPLIRGALGEETRELFIGALERIFQLRRNAIMPIEVSQEELSQDAYFNMNGIHWNGLRISVVNNEFHIEIIDPAHSPQQNTDLTDLTIQGICKYSETLSKLVELIRRAAATSKVKIHINWLMTQQQTGDLDCGAWTVDNLVRRAQNLPLRARNDIAGGQLRQEQEVLYTNRLSPQ